MARANQSKRPVKPESRPPKSQASGRRVWGDLIVMGVLLGIARALGKLGTRRTTNSAAQALPSLSDAADRGRDADAPSEVPAKGWKDVAWRVFENIQRDRVMLIAAGVTYYALLSLFPATAALVSLYGLFADASSISRNLALLAGFLPEGALEVIGDQVQRIVDQGQATLGATFLGTLALSLWSANAGTKAIFDALNIIYKEREQRSFIALTLQALAFTGGGIVVALIALIGIVVVPIGLKLLGIPGQSGATLLAVLRWPLLYLVILGGLACLYRWGPSRTRAEWQWVSWGSAIAGAVWLGGSLILSWYVANFGMYNATYGSLGAVIGFMVWLWLSLTVILIGGEINAELEHQTASDTTDGIETPIGLRGATMADNIGPART